MGGAGHRGFHVQGRDLRHTGTVAEPYKSSRELTSEGISKPGPFRC